MNKDELLRMMESLPVEQLKLVSEYVEKTTEDNGLYKKAFNHVIDSCGDALREVKNQ